MIDKMNFEELEELSGGKEVSDVMENDLFGVSDVSRTIFMEDIDSLMPDVSLEDSEIEDVVANYKFFDVDCDRVLLVLSKPCTLHFYGCISVESVAGSVEVCGYHIDPSKSKAQVYSCDGFAPMYFTTLNQDDIHDDIDLSIFLEFGLNLMEATKVCNSVKVGGCALLLSHPEKREFARPAISKRAEHRLGILVGTPRRSIGNKLLIPSELMFDATGITVLCGGRGVGKSTSLRYLANRCINKIEKLVYIDLDIGQPEFTLQECVSAVLVDQPILGPSFTHFRKPLYSYNVGNIDVSRCVSSYLKAVETLISKVKSSHGNLPWLVNTMGFPKGVGVYITTSILALLSPNLVIQIEGNRSQNFPSDLTPSFVTQESSRPVSEFRLLKFEKKYSLDKGLVPSLTNKQIRCLVIEWYFNNSLKPSYPLTCSVRTLKVFNVTSRQQIPQEHYSKLVSKIVVLSSSDSLDESLEAIDFGIILSYVETDEVFLINTPLEPCSNIKSLLVGSLQIPSKLNKAISPRFSGILPYSVLSQSKAAPTMKPLKRRFRFLFEQTFNKGPVSNSISSTD